MEQVPPRRRQNVEQQAATPAEVPVSPKKTGAKTATKKTKVASNKSQRRITLLGIVLITLTAITCVVASYTVLAEAQHTAQTTIAQSQSNLDAANAQYDALISRLDLEKEYRDYAYQASVISIENDKAPADSPIMITSRHRDPNQLNVIINKQNPIYPLSYTPKTVEISCAGEEPTTIAESMQAALGELCNAARNAGLQLALTSGYRSYRGQIVTYRWWASFGAEKAETHSARPGFSEHQAGTAVDFSVRDGAALDQFCKTSERTWLTENAYKFGFIQRYTEENAVLSGYAPECWHFRYIGKEPASDYTTKGISSLETYWNMQGGTYTAASISN